MPKVLVVEDNPVNMKLAVLLLQKMGHHVVCAIDAESAMVLALEELPDLILMDVQLPGMDGFTAITLLKEGSATATIPIVALTAMSRPTNMQNGAFGGCDAFIAKPFHYQELYTVINILLKKKQWSIEENKNDHANSQETLISGQEGRVTSIENLSAALDIDLLTDLIGHDPIVIGEFLVAFKLSAAIITRELKSACVNHQAMLVAECAHKLKSASYAVGAQTLGRLCAAIETACHANDIESMMTLLPLLERDLGNVHTMLDSILAAIGSSQRYPPL